MAKNFIADGKTVDFISSSALVSGQPVVLGAMVCIAADTVASGQATVAHTEGVWMVPKLSSDNIQLGEKLYLSAGAFTRNSGAPGAVYAGVAFSAAAAGVTSVWLKLDV